MLNWLVEEKSLAPHIPVNDKSKRDDGTFSHDVFRQSDQRCLPLPRRKAARDEAQRTKARRFCIVQQARLRYLPVQTAVLPERKITQDPARYP